MISLATKAGKTASGEFATEQSVKSFRAELVIVATDASDNTKKKFQNMCEFYEVPIYFYKDKAIFLFPQIATYFFAQQPSTPTPTSSNKPHYAIIGGLSNSRRKYVKS